MRRLNTGIGLVAFAAAAALALSGCSGSSAPTGSGSASGDVGAFPVSIDSALGTTTIESAPERVATWGWGATDAVLALGIVPVAIPADNYSGGDDKMPPWISDKISEMGGDTPELLDDTTLSVEDLLKVDADVLIAPYSGLTQEDYDAVTAAGIPVVAYTDAAWSTPWRDVITATGEALGKEGEAKGLLDDLDKQISDAAAAHPEFEGTTVAYVDDDVDTFYMYLPNDARVEILEDLGFTTPASVTDLDNKESTFYATVSYENLDKIDAQVIFTQGEDQATLDEFTASARGQLIPAVKKDAVAEMVGAEQVAAVSPTALTIPYILPTIVEKLAAATAIAKG